MILIAIFITVVFLHSLFSRRLARTVVTAPIIFTVAGMLAVLVLPEMQVREGGQEIFLHVAEIGLVLLLFTDASRTDRRGKKDRDLLVMLERLAVMRLLHHYTLSEIQVRLPEAWALYRNRKWYDDRQQGLRDFRELISHRDAERIFPKSWETKAQRAKMATLLPGK